MSKAQEIIDDIDNFLERYSLKTNKLTSQDLIDFIEAQWEKADEEKYSIHFARIIMGRMITEYTHKKDFKNMMRWLNMSNLHKSSQEHPNYVLNYYNGQCCLQCGNEEKALEYFNLCYDENPDYIFTREPFCAEFFNKHLKNPRELPKQEEPQEELDCGITLSHWQEFFKEQEDLSYEVFDEYDEEVEQLTEKHHEILNTIQENQKEILTNILTELLKQYPSLQEKYDYSEEDKPYFMPDLSSIADFSNLLSPISIYILEGENEEPYIGFLFGCSWDREHSLGVMTYKKQVIKIGGGDCAFIP